MPGLADIFGKGGVAEQFLLWGVVNQLTSPLLGPYARLLENKVNSITQAVPLSPDENARLVIRNYRSMNDAIAEAKENGISPDDFAALVKATGNPIAPGDAAEALRRGIIPEDSGSPDDVSFVNAIRQGDIQNKWADVIKKLAMQIPSPADALQAVLEGQVTEAEGRSLFAKFGGDPEFYQMLFNTRGQAPTPNEALTLANRGIIPWTGSGPDSVSFEQAFLEGPWRNKWLQPFRELGNYLPPPRTITAMVHEGVLTDAQALALWRKQGLSEELATAYLASAHSAKTAAHKHLTLGIIETGYKDQALSREEAGSLIVGLGYSQADTDFILTTVDLQRQIASVNHALNTVHSRYISGHIDRSTALGAIDSLGISAAQRDNLLTEWDIERKARVAILTPAQIKKAIAATLLTETEGIQRLENIGYSAQDAAIILAI
jgi:hypothetical protein